MTDTELEELVIVWTLQMTLLRFVCKVIANYSPRIWKQYWDEIAEIETTVQAKAFLIKHGFLEKYNDYKKGENKK